MKSKATFSLISNIESQAILCLTLLFAMPSAIAGTFYAQGQEANASISAGYTIYGPDGQLEKFSFSRSSQAAFSGPGTNGVFNDVDGSFPLISPTTSFGSANVSGVFFPWVPQADKLEFDSWTSAKLAGNRDDPKSFYDGSTSVSTTYKADFLVLKDSWLRLDLNVETGYGFEGASFNLKFENLLTQNTIYDYSYWGVDTDIRSLKLFFPKGSYEVNAGGGALANSGEFRSIDIHQKFTLAPVPEPSTFALMLAGLGIAVIGFRKNRS
jgi:hypothetical protein